VLVPAPDDLTCGEFLTDVPGQDRYAGFTLLAARAYEIPTPEQVDTFAKNLIGFCVLEGDATPVKEVADQVLTDNPSYLQ
jgi:hypothetical protein